MLSASPRPVASLLPPAVAAVLVAGAGSSGPGPVGSAPADTVLDGFHGYVFGVRAARIGEIDSSRPPEYTVDGMEVYVRTLRFVGMPARTYFYLDPEDRRLRRGKHLIEPDASSCVRQLTTLRLMVSGTHPDLRTEVVRGSGAEADPPTAGRGGAPPVRCPAFVDADTARDWTVLFRNPASGALEARMELFRRGGEPRILACYLNESDCEWPDSVDVRPGPKLRAPERAPDTTGAGRPSPRDRQGRLASEEKGAR